MTQTLTRVAVVMGGLAIVAASACSPPPVLCVEGDEATCDAGSLPVDRCNTPESAKSDPACKLTLCQDLEAFISTVDDGGIDVDFYSVTMPAGLTARSLLTVKAGYGGVPQTAVNFSVNVLREQGDGGLAAFASGSDRRMGAAVPKNVELTQPFSESNAQLLVRVSDVGGVALPRVDNKNPYKLNVCVIDNPDVNEPNDVTPTAITLTAANGVQQGASSGFLATNDDLDRFSFPVSGARQIIYVRISSTMMNLMPPLPFRMAYTLKDPMGRPVSEGVMDNEFLQINLATARLTAGDGTYTLEVFGYKMAQQMTPAPGDLRLKYDVEVRLMPDLDLSEGSGGNDTSATARPVNLALNATTALTGRLSFVPDNEWFRLNLPTRQVPTVLRYELMPAGTGGRFPPLSMIPTRQIRVIQEVTSGATIQDRQTACVSNPQVCPRSFDDPNAGPGLLVSGACRSPGIDPPHCLLSERNEEYQIAPLRNQKNFVGAIPVASNVSAILFSFGDTGRGRLKYADDREWSIRVTLEDDPDEAPASRPAGDIPLDVTLGSTASTVRGVLSHGYGKTIAFEDLNMGPGIRGPNDYDATETDRDAYRFSYGMAMGDQTWQLEWTVGDVDGGSGPAGTLAFELLLCTGAQSPDGGCTGRQSVLAPTYGAFTPWYLPIENMNRRVQFTQTRQGNATVVRVEPVACFCFSQDKVASGSFQMRVVAVDRTSNDPIAYAVRQSITPYPGSFQNPDGGSMPVGCPGRGADGGGGCGFQTR